MCVEVDHHEGSVAIGGVMTDLRSAPDDVGFLAIALRLPVCHAPPVGRECRAHSVEGVGIGSADPVWRLAGRTR